MTKKGGKKSGRGGGDGGDADEAEASDTSSSEKASTTLEKRMEEMFNTMKAEFSTQLSAQETTLRAEFQARLDQQARSQTIATDAGSNAGRQPASQPFGRDTTGTPAVNFRQAHKSPPVFDSTITLEENLRNLFAKTTGTNVHPVLRHMHPLFGCEGRGKKNLNVRSPTGALTVRCRRPGGDR